MQSNFGNVITPIKEVIPIYTHKYHNIPISKIQWDAGYARMLVPSGCIGMLGHMLYNMLVSAGTQHQQQHSGSCKGGSGSIQGCGPLTCTLFGENVCENDGIGSCREGIIGHAPRSANGNG